MSCQFLNYKENLVLVSTNKAANYKKRPANNNIQNINNNSHNVNTNYNNVSNNKKIIKSAEKAREIPKVLGKCNNYKVSYNIFRTSIFIICALKGCEVGNVFFS